MPAPVWGRRKGSFVRVLLGTILSDGSCRQLGLAECGAEDENGMTVRRRQNELFLSCGLELKYFFKMVRADTRDGNKGRPFRPIFVFVVALRLFL